MYELAPDHVFKSKVTASRMSDMTEVTEEADKLGEHGLIGEDDFREFVFANPAH